MPMSGNGMAIQIAQNIDRESNLHGPQPQTSHSLCKWFYELGYTWDKVT